MESVALTPQDVEARWNDLAVGDGPRAFQAIWDLTFCPQPLDKKATEGP